MYAQIHGITTAFNKASTYIIRWHAPFYQYLKIHMLVAEWQFLLPIDVPIQDRAQQFQIYEIFNLGVPHGDVSTQYKINNKYIGITYDETQTVMITEQQYLTCLYASGKVCTIDAPFQALMNASLCIMALCAKNDWEIRAEYSSSVFHKPPAFPPIVITSNLWIFILILTMQELTITMTYPNKVTSSSLFQQTLHILKLPPACCATSRHLHLHPHHEDQTVTLHLNAINVLIPDVHIWQHFGIN